MVLEDPTSDESTQVVRRVYENEDLNTTASLSKVFRLECHFDDVSGKSIILWDDILAAFKGVVHVRVGERILPFLKGRNFKTLDPLRIAALPGVILDVVVAEQSIHSESVSSQETPSKILPKELSVESLQEALPSPSQEQRTTDSNNNNNNNNNNDDDDISSSSSSLATNNTIRRNPAYGLVEEALQNYTHIENPATAPTLRGPQSLSDSCRPAATDKISAPAFSTSRDQSRDPQGITSGPRIDFVEAMVRARLGEKDAQVVLGDIYRGKGVYQDYQAAMDWYSKAAEQGSAEAQRNIARMYYYGQGVPQDYDLALEWYQKSADQGYTESQRSIGYLYQEGRGVPQDYGKAMEWYRKAADQGNASAQQNIGWLYEVGVGVPRDYSKAMEWYQKAADGGDVGGQHCIGYLYQEGLGVPQDYGKAIEWYQKAADHGNVDSQYNLGVLYKESLGSLKDKAKAVEWFLKAADQGDEDAKREIAQLEQQDNSVQTKKKKAGLLQRLFSRDIGIY